MRMMMVLMMLALPAMAVKASDLEDQLTNDAIAIMRAAILCPADGLPDRAHATLIVEELFLATGHDLKDAQGITTGLIAFIVRDEPALSTPEEIRVCQQLAHEAGPNDFIRRLDALASRYCCVREAYASHAASCASQ